MTKAIYEIDNFLDIDHCNEILHLRRSDSLINGVLTDFLVYQDKASKPWLTHMKMLTDKISSYLEIYNKNFFEKLPISNMSISHLGFLNDEFGEFTEIHYDWNSVIVKNEKRGLIFKPLVMLLYLTDIEKGGELLFPLQDYKIIPKAGKLAIFPAHFTFPHVSMPVEKGSKHVCRITYKIDNQCFEVDELEI